jgi:hypothetical protein
MSLSDFVSFLKVFSPGATPANSNDSRRQVLTRLKFIGRLQPHDKIDLRTLRVESNSIMTPLKRLFVTGDSRETTLNFFSSTIDRSFEIIAAHINSSNVSERIFCANVIQDLIASVKGLRATQGTYADDNYTVCEIDVLIQTVQAKIWEIQQAHPDLFTMKELCVVQIDKDTEDTSGQPVINSFIGNIGSEERTNRPSAGTLPSGFPPRNLNQPPILPVASTGRKAPIPIAHPVTGQGTAFSPVSRFSGDITGPLALIAEEENEEYENDGDRGSVDIIPSRSSL